MKLIIYGIIIGIGKIIPGISGAVIAVSLGVYEKSIDSIANFFNNPKKNATFLLSLGSGIILAIILLSKIILYLIKNYYLISIMLFIGLIISEIIKFSKQIIYTKKNIILMLIIIIIFLFFPNKSIINNNDSAILYLISGYIEAFSSIIPGISGTSLLMTINMYDKILALISNIINYNYVINNFLKYFLYGLGMFISFIINIKLMSYISKKKENLFKTIILSLSIGSVILLFKTIKFNISITTIYGIMSLIIGLFVGIII